MLFEHHISMISEGSRETENWSNDAENSALHHRNKLHFKIDYNKNSYLTVIMFHNMKVLQYYQ